MCEFVEEARRVSGLSSWTFVYLVFGTTAMAAPRTATAEFLGMPEA